MLSLASSRVHCIGIPCCTSVVATITIDKHARTLAFESRPVALDVRVLEVRDAELEGTLAIIGNINGDVEFVPKRLGRRDEFGSCNGCQLCTLRRVESLLPFWKNR